MRGHPAGWPFCCTRAARTAAYGFTLLELAIVLLVVGLAIGGIVLGQELVTTARVRNLLAQQDGVKTAYFAFLDRFGSPPGDYARANTTIAGIEDATAACGLATPNRGNGNGNQRIELANGEYILAWEHLSRAGMITGAYRCSGNTTVDSSSVPVNAYGQYLQLIHDDNFANAAGMGRPNVKTGNQVPSNILSEADRKIDDGNAAGGSFRGSTYSTAGAIDTGCYDATTGAWGVGLANCSAARLF